MTSPKQRLANQRNALKSSGPRTEQGRRRASQNATKHSLSLPLDALFFSKEINAVVGLIALECVGQEQALELAKRIVDYERIEAYLYSQGGQPEEPAPEELVADPHTAALNNLMALHRGKQPVGTTFTTSKKRLKGKERSEEIQFIQRFLRIMDQSRRLKEHDERDRTAASLRYQKRSTNQLLKGLKAAVASEQEI